MRVRVEKDIFYGGKEGERTIDFRLEEGVYRCTVLFESPFALLSDHISINLRREDVEERRVKKRFDGEKVEIVFDLIVVEDEEWCKVVYEVNRSLHHQGDPFEGRVTLTARQLFPEK